MEGDASIDFKGFFASMEDIGMDIDNEVINAVQRLLPNHVHAKPMVVPKAIIRKPKNNLKKRGGHWG